MYMHIHACTYTYLKLQKKLRRTENYYSEWPIQGTLCSTNQLSFPNIICPLNWGDDYYMKYMIYIL